MNVKECRDCLAERVAKGAAPPPGKPRPIVEGSGGRCATHWRMEKARRKSGSHESRVRKVYGLGPGDYGRLYQAQGGKCAICQRGTGASRRLAVDHDHSDGRARGLLCSPCNKLLGHLRDDVDAVLRIYTYLSNPPASRLGIVAIHEDKRGEAT